MIEKLNNTIHYVNNVDGVINELEKVYYKINEIIDYLNNLEERFEEVGKTIINYELGKDDR